MNKDSFDINEFLRRFGILIYTGDPEGDLLLIEDELREMRRLGMIDNEEYLQALAALKERVRRRNGP